ncbi:FAD-dependent oxidoreductase [Paenibacillus tarimensis]
MEKWDVVVVGGGLGGWIAAAYAAKGGKRVMLAEKAARFGGRALTVHKKGVYLNLGGHAIYRDGECFSVLEELGAAPEGGIPASAGHMVKDGNIHVIPANVMSLMTTRLLSFRGKIELARLLMELKGLDTAKLPQGSLKEWADRAIREPEVRHLIYALCRTATYAHHPEAQTVGPVLRQIKHALNGGALYVDQGWSTVVERLRQSAVQAGARAEAGKAVAGITLQPPERTGTEGSLYEIRFADGELRYANAVVLAVPPDECCRLVEGSAKTALDRWRRQARPVTAACLDLGMLKLPDPRVQFVMGLDSPFLFTNQSRAAKLSDNGMLAVHIMKYHGPSEPDAARDMADLERMMDLLQPGWRKEVQVRHYLPCITVVHDYDHISRAEAPGPAVPELPGLYVAGDWAGHGELLADAAAASGKRAAEALLRQADFQQGGSHGYDRAVRTI